MKNVRPFDRFLRAAVAVVLFEAGYFWLGGPWNWICFGLGAILLLTAIMGICPLYRLLGIASAPAKQQRRPVLVALAALLLAALVIGGAYGSMFFSRKLFLEDFNAMNAHYKQALFLTGKGDRQGAVSNLDDLLPAFEAFWTKYGNYRPYALKGDAELASNFITVRQILLRPTPWFVREIFTRPISPSRKYDRCSRTCSSAMASRCCP